MGNHRHLKVIAVRPGQRVLIIGKRYHRRTNGNTV